MITEVTDQDGITIIELSKDVTRFTLVLTEEVESEIKPLINTPNAKIIIDLNHVEFVDSRAIGTFVALVKTAKSVGSHVKFCNLMPEVDKIFTLLNLQAIMDIKITRQECIASYAN